MRELEMLLYTEKERKQKKSVDRKISYMHQRREMVANQAGKQASLQRNENTDQISKLKLKVFLSFFFSSISHQE